MKAAHLKPPATERLIFWSVAIILLSQMGWWISLQIRESRNLQNARIATMRAGRAEAWQMDSAEILRIVFQRDPSTAKPGTVEAKLPQFPPLPVRKAAIENRFPYVAVVPSPVEPDDPILLDQSGYLTLRVEVLDAMERERTLALRRSWSSPCSWA